MLEFFDFEAGLRHDLYPWPQRSYGVLGLEGLAREEGEDDDSLAFVAGLRFWF